MAENNPLFRPLILAVILTGLLCRLAFAVFTPTFYAPDEQAQFNYIQYLWEHQAFPVLTVISDKAAGESEYHQPPLYYLAMVLLLGLGQAVFRNLTGTVVFLRAFSILLWMLTCGSGHSFETAANQRPLRVGFCHGVCQPAANLHVCFLNHQQRQLAGGLGRRHALSHGRPRAIPAAFAFAGFASWTCLVDKTIGGRVHPGNCPFVRA